MNSEAFQKLTSKGPVLLDGATGSYMMAQGMPKGICTEQWILDHPDCLLSLQRDYIEAGSQIIYAPTFGANRISLANYGLAAQVERLNTELVQLSRNAVGDSAVYIAGDLTTAGKIEFDYDDLFEVYSEQIAALDQAGVDLLVAETMIGAEETMAAIDAAHAVCDLPVLCTLTMQADGSLFFGGNIFDTAPQLEAMGADAVGINCSTGPEQLESIIHNLSSLLSIPVIAKPNAGVPIINEQGIAEYHMTPEEFAGSMKRLLDLGASIVGGCCGTTPAYIAALRTVI